MIRALLAAVSGLALASTASAAYPEKPITFIVHTGAGSITDTGVRTWQPYMEECLGTTIIVQNMPGAGGSTAFYEVANAEPDGYTLGGLNAPNMPGKTITGDVRFTIDDFDYLGSLYGTSVSLNVLKTSQFETMADIVEAAKAGSRPLPVGLSQVGGDDFITQHQFMKEAGVELELIPLGDSAATRNGLLGGHVEVVSMSATDAAPYQDQVRTLAVAAEERTELLPDVPTFRELGYDVVGGSYHVIGAPKGIPQEAKDKLDSCFQQVADNPEFQKDAATRSLLLNPMDAAATEERVKSLTADLKELWETSPW
jgi:tripartite-type tricarboxylate transporter receptor subunit TctC